MSLENRKRMYDELVAAGRTADIDQALHKEFDKPLPPEPPTLPPKKKLMGLKRGK